MSRSNIQHQHLKGIRSLQLFHPEQLKDLDDDAVASALLTTQVFVRPDTFKFVLEVALERRGCLEFLLSCKIFKYSCPTRSHLIIVYR